MREMRDFEIIPRERSLQLQFEQVRGLGADTTGVKLASPFGVRVNSRYIKAIKLKASWTAHPADSIADSITEVRAVGTKTGTIASISGNIVTDGESEGKTFADDELVYLEVEVKRASKALGATVDLEYAVLEFILREK